MKKPVPATFAEHKVALLALLPATQKEILRALGVGSATVCRWLRKLEADGEAHVGSWGKGDFGYAVRVYHAGRGPTPAKPARLTALERNVAYRRRQAALRAEERQRAEDAAQEELDRPRQVRTASWPSAPVQRDPLLAAFFS